MSKSIKLKVLTSITPSFIAGTLVNGRVDDEGNISVTKQCTAENKRKRIVLSTGIGGEVFVSGPGGCVAATFSALKTKTIKCVKVDHSLSCKKTFKAGKRYQVDMGRAFGSFAGNVFDENGEPFSLYREEVGFSCATASFEALYS